MHNHTVTNPSTIPPNGALAPIPPTILISNGGSNGHIGKRIVEEEQEGKERAEYGDAILKNLSIALTEEFGKGFSYANLRNFRQFYLTYPDRSICYTLRSKLTWTHHRLIMRVENPEAGDYYIKEAVEQNWSSGQLERNINTFYYQRLLSSRNKEEALLHRSIQEKSTANDFIKDPYVFEFLNMPQPVIWPV